MTQIVDFIPQLHREFDELGLSESLKKLRDKFDGRLAFSTSFSIEDQVVTDAIFRNELDIDVFTLDTGRNFPETYKTLAETTERYQQKITVQYPQTDRIEAYTTQQGINSMYKSVALRKECCNIRKMEPLNRALQGAAVWITGLRRSQSENRTSLALFEQDTQRNLVKFSPLLDWSTEKVWAYIRQYEVPYNSLYNQGFASIGCAPCTRAIAKGEDERAGRWWWEESGLQESGLQECGLHTNAPKLAGAAA